jgi:predicted GIY-YIG superfamily endonuclease
MIKKWTKEKCQEESLKYQNKIDFLRKSCGAYSAAYKNGWLNEICTHMIEKRKIPNYWTFERCKEEVLKYKTFIELKMNNETVYNIIFKNNWSNIICNHLIRNKKPNNYWTFERCKVEALKYKLRIDFCKNSGSAYNKAAKNKWLDTICSHMDIVGNVFNRCLYIWFFDDKCVYIGLTHNFKKRKYNHTVNEESQVYKKLKTNIGNCIQMTGYLDIKSIRKLEKFYIKKYEKYFIVLNKSKGGEIGRLGLSKYSKSDCYNITKNYNTIKELKIKYTALYYMAYRKGWIPEICSHMKTIGKRVNVINKKPNNYWTFERCKVEALKYKNRTSFQISSKGAYLKCVRNCWLDGVCSHMPKRKIRNKKY